MGESSSVSGIPEQHVDLFASQARAHIATCGMSQIILLFALSHVFLFAMLHPYSASRMSFLGARTFQEEDEELLCAYLRET
jgi:hypothetical protein